MDRGYSLKLEVRFCVQGVISPLLANLYLNRFLKYFRLQGKSKIWRAEIVSYADDFVILTQRSVQQWAAQQARAWTQQTMTRLGLTLNESKTSVRDALHEDFDFLGYTFGPRYWWKTGHRYTAARPSKKSIQRLTAALRGWQNYFRQGSVSRAYTIVNRYVEQRVRSFLRRRHLPSGVRGTRRFSTETIFGVLGVHRCARSSEPAWAFP